MRKSLLLLVALLLAACDITIVLPGSQLQVDGPEITSGSLASGESARFEVYAGATAVRLEATDLDNGAAGSLLLRVYDASNVLYAQTLSHRYFIAPRPEIAAEGAVEPGVADSPVYSINIPAGSGRMYFEVTNLAAGPTRVSARAVSRAPLPYSDDVFDPTPADFAATTTGALLYLGQTDVWRYTGSGPATLELDGGETVHATARIVGGGVIKANLEPGEYYSGLENGDVVYVQAQGNGATAGFCANLSGCNDYLDSGEYTLAVTVP
ncbi:hypothetical protein [Oceanithermus sp.]